VSNADDTVKLRIFDVAENGEVDDTDSMPVLPALSLKSRNAANETAQSQYDPGTNQRLDRLFNAVSAMDKRLRRIEAMLDGDQALSAETQGAGNSPEQVPDPVLQPKRK